MVEGSAPDPSRKITDRDLARLVRRGIEEAADDPSATEMYRRIQQRESLNEDREHRKRSDKSAVFGVLAGLALLVIFIVGLVVTFRP